MSAGETAALSCLASHPADQVADSDRVEAPDLRHGSGERTRLWCCLPVREHVEPRDLSLSSVSEVHAVASVKCSREESDVRHLLRAEGSLDLEDGPGRCSIRVSCGSRQSSAMPTMRA